MKVLIILLGLLLSCNPGGGPEPLDPPTGPGAMAARLSVAGEGRVLLTWLEREGERQGHRLLYSELRGLDWSSPKVLAAGNAFFANWADLPGVAESGTGELFAHWLEMLGGETYAYGASVVRSQDGGETWTAVGLLHDDASPQEHGFVSYVSLPDAVQAFWLDGRQMGSPGGAMQLRTAILGRSTETPQSTLLDDRVCECCSTDAALGAAGPLIVYRDRSDAEVRDIALIRKTEAGWSEPTRVATDNWKIQGCPVNGPAIDAQSEAVAVAWFTASESRPRVQVAFSDDGGSSFGEPMVVDAERPLGRVDVALDEGRAWLLWMGHGGTIWLQSTARDGELGERLAVAKTSGKRVSGCPKLVRQGRRLIVSWKDEDSIRVALRELE